MIQPPGLFLIGLVCQTNDEAVLSKGRAAQLAFVTPSRCQIMWVILKMVSGHCADNLVVVVALLRAGEYISQNVTTHGLDDVVSSHEGAHGLKMPNQACQILGPVGGSVMQGTTVTTTHGPWKLSLSCGFAVGRKTWTCFRSTVGVHCTASRRPVSASWTEFDARSG